MSYPFRSEGIFGRPQSPRRAKLLSALQDRLARIIRRNRSDRQLAERVRLVFDSLEPRLLLNADLNVNLSTDPATQDHDLLVRLVEEVQTVNLVSTTIRRVEILDQTSGGKVLAFGDLSTINSINIVGGAGNDTLTIDEDSFGANGLPGGATVSFNGGGGLDRLIYDSSEATGWTVSGDQAGSINGGAVDLSFSNVENLLGTDGTADTFTFTASGKLSGVVDGGFGGTDTIVYSGVSATANSGQLGANGSGSVGLSNSSTLTFENMEPFNVGGGIGVQNLASQVTNKSVTITAANSNTLRVAITGGSTQDIAATGPVWLYLGEAADVTTINSLPTDAGFSLMVDAGEDIIVAGDLNVAGSLGLKADDITINAGTNVSADRIEVKAVDWSRVSLDAAAANADGDSSDATLVVSRDTAASVLLGGNLTGNTVVLNSVAANTVRMHGMAKPAVKTIATTMVNSSTVTINGSVTGGAVDIGANTDVAVEIMLTEVPIPNMLGLAEITLPTTIFSTASRPLLSSPTIVLPQNMIDAILYPDLYKDEDGAWRRESDDVVVQTIDLPSYLHPTFDPLSGAFASALESGQVAMEEIQAVIEYYKTQLDNLHPGNFFDTDSVDADVIVTNDTTVTVAASAVISATTGAGTVTVAADDHTVVRDIIQTEVDAIRPKLSTIVVFSAIDSDTLIDRATSVMIGTPVPDAVPGTLPNGLKATTSIAISATSAGEVRNEIVSNQMGSATNEATETTSAIVRGVKIDGGTTSSRQAVGGFSLSAVSNTGYSATTLDADNVVIGATTASLMSSDVLAGTGGVSVSAIDRSSVTAIAVPFLPPLDLNGEAPDPAVKKHIARVAVINQVQKDTIAAISASTIVSAGDVTVEALNITTVTAFAEAVPQEEEETELEALLPINAKKVNAGLLVANVINGGTTASITGGSVTTTGAGDDVTVKATDDGFLDASIFVNMEGRGLSGTKILKMLKGGSASAARMEAMNIIGWDIGGGPTVKGNTLAFQKATLDAILGTEFFQDPDQVQISASITDAVITAGGAVAAIASSKGVANTTVTSASKQTNDVGVLKAAPRCWAWLLPTTRSTGWRQR